MKKQFLSLFSSVLISLTLVTGSAFATDEAMSTLTATEMEQSSQSHGTETPDSHESNYQDTHNDGHDSNTSNHDDHDDGHDHDTNNHDDHNDGHDDDTNNHDTHHGTGNCGTGTNGTGTVTTGSNTTGSLDLWIRKGSYINGTTTGNIGDIINYVITYGNGGSIVATGVTITDVFPLGLANTQLSGRTQSGSVFTYNLGTLNPGDSGQILFTGIVLTGAVSGINITNTANITSSTFEDGILLGNNTSSTTVVAFATGSNGTGGNGTGTTGGIADVFVIKTASIQSGNVGGEIVYTLTYGNTGNAIATGIKLTDEFPVAVSGNMAGWTNLTGNIWQIALPDMVPGFVGSVSITGTLAMGATFGMNIINLAEITTSSTENNLLNNSSYVQTKSYAQTDDCHCRGNNSLKGVVYVDSMRNNQYNAGFDGVLSGVVVNLYTNGVLTNTTLTDANGSYLFGLLPDNTYDVGYVMPAGLYIAVVSNIGDKGGVSTSVMKLSSIVLSGGVVSSLNNFGLITQGGGSSGGGGGGFAGGISTTPTTPSKPTPTKDPIIPLGPSIDTPDELLNTGPEILPQELLASGPDIAIDTLSEQGTVTAKVSTALQTTNAFIQNIPTTVATLSVRPITYVNVLLGYEGALSALIRNILLALFGSLIVTVLVYGAHRKANVN